MLVCKFGGSSLSDSEQFNKVRNIIMENTERKVIVLSAPGKRYKNDTKITDLLYHCCTRSANSKGFDREFNEIRQRFFEIAENCSIDIDLESEFAEIYETIISTKDADYAASRGEYLCGKLMSRYLGFTFVDAKDLMFFNENGTINEEKTYSAINSAVEEFGRIVIPGFYGSMNGKIKTFSRGGSDITGALAAAAVNACLYENWTDVSGILMADPRIVTNPMAIESISYSQLRELAHAGAGVLHEDAVSPAKSAGIPINIKNTNRPFDRGTIICSNSSGTIRPIAGISGKRDFSIIAVESDDVAENFVCMRAVLDVLAGFSVPVENVISDAEGFSVIIPTCGLSANLENITNSLQAVCCNTGFSILNNISLISVVGGEAEENRNLSGYLLNALDNKMINIRTVHQTSKCSNVTVGVNNGDFEKTINALYDSVKAIAI